jgi:hypothetical protein
MNHASIDMAMGFLVEQLDIPQSHYERAADRYRSLAEWLHRKDSKVASLSPEVYLQGSFRYGTVIKPLVASEAYDLDLVCQVNLSKINVNQKQVKELLGEEIAAYANAHSFKQSTKAKHRCWRLEYADDVAFHLDILPCIPEDAATIRQLIEREVAPDLASHAVAITDDRHHSYAMSTTDWPSSNPRGFAKWFEGRLQPYAREKQAQLVRKRAYATIDKVPPYEWATVLQRCIQILKRHRDLWFQDALSLKPISMIITTLATQSYKGEPDLFEALSGIVNRMASHIHPSNPRLPNPLNHAEDFAERWAVDREIERNFWLWHRQAEADFLNLHERISNVSDAAGFMREKFAVSLTDAMEERLEERIVSAAGAVRVSVPSIHIAAAPKPWRRHE